MIKPEISAVDMDLRDYFAAAALQGLLTYDGRAADSPNGMRHIEIQSYRIADEMLKEREEQP